MKRNLICLMLVVCAPVAPCLAAAVALDVPLVRQTQGRLCGPAAVEMVFQFWCERRFDQYAIARQIGSEFAGEKRFANGTFAQRKDARSYPGTPVYIMRKYLEQRAASKKYSLRALPTDPVVLDDKFNKAFAWMKRHLDQGVPVVVHQFWRSTGSLGHYRVMTGYDDDKQLVYLNDAKAGRIVQTFDEFKQKGAVPGKWMAYYAIAFNHGKSSPPYE